MSRGILAANGFEAWVTRMMWFYMWISTAVLMYVIWWYRAKFGSVIVHLFFISVKSIEFSKFLSELKQQKTVGFCFLYFWHLTALTFPTERFWVTGLEVLFCLWITRLIPDASQLCLCDFQTIMFGPFWGKKKGL